ncbi:MAG TPA: hypothetical protein DCZ95_11875 [Verrucomicrobia bacterium]|nr:MAG: hypothetical protein A2X46_13920 [Lentisphaerae bacterium GWF2_57_35]HBA84783.1 hypothetical protein [Verrucomicrobiota bacterium]
MGKDKKRIQQNRAKKNARLAARKAQRKRQQHRMEGSLFAQLGFTRGQIEHAPIHQVWANREFFELGIGSVFVSRILPDGHLIIGVFLVDVYCLGIKDAFLSALSPREFQEELLAKARLSEPLHEVSPAYARKLIEGSIAYASNLGLEPHDDYEKASVVLGDIDASACQETFVFGHKGKPFYAQGPNHTDSQALAIVTQLRERCGLDGFEFMLESDLVDRPDDEDDQTDLRDL